MILKAFILCILLIAPITFSKTTEECNAQTMHTIWELNTKEKAVKLFMKKLHTEKYCPYKRKYGNATFQLFRGKEVVIDKKFNINGYEISEDLEKQQTYFKEIQNPKFIIKLPYDTKILKKIDVKVIWGDDIYEGKTSGLYP